MAIGDIVNKAKNVLSGRDPSEGTPISPDKRKDVVDQCKVIWYQWENEIESQDNAIFNFASLLPSVSAESLSAARAYDISNHIENFSYSKSMGAAAGTFSFTLHNTKDWSRIMRPGQWLTMYLSHDGDLPLPTEVAVAQDKGRNLKNAASLLANVANAKGTVQLPPVDLPSAPEASKLLGLLPKLRLVGVIQRIGIRSLTTADGTIEVSYQVSGKDFGIVYEETALWFNANAAQETTFTAFLGATTKNFERNLAKLLEKYHMLFLQTRKALGGGGINDLNNFYPEQWVIPKPLTQHLGLELDGEPYFGNIKGITSFYPTVFEHNMANPLAGLQGQAWSKLKELSGPEFHELFTELSDDNKPVLILRPIPWAMDKSGYPLLGQNVLRYRDLAENSGLPSLGSVLGAIKPEMPSFKDFAPAGTSLPGSSAGSSSFYDARKNHRVGITAVEVESYDIGPDFHNRYNFFLVQDGGKSGFANLNAFALVGKSFDNTPFPFRDEADIKRYGFKPMNIATNAFLIANRASFEKLYPQSPDKGFILEANHLMRDYHARAEDYYSGTMNTIGKNEIRLGKVVLTDETLPGIGKMVFYVEGYTDTFSVNADGTASWTQTLQLTRGIEYDDLLKNVGTKLKQPIEKVQSFHVNKTEATGNNGAVSKIKNVIKKPF